MSLSLRSFDRLVPKDRGAGPVMRGAVYGPDPRHRLDLYAPARLAEGRLLPVIVFLYGGSWASGLRQGYGFAGRALAAQGFLAAVPDYRLVPDIRFPAFLEDCAAAVRWVAEHAARFGGDPERIVLAGHSAGAYNAAMLALDPQWLGGERSRVRGLIGLAGPYDFLPLKGPATLAAFGEAPDLAATQPVGFASNGGPPALLLHGAEDRTVSPRNSRRLAEALQEGGGKAEARLYPRIGHIAILTALARPFRRRAPVLADMAAFAHRAAGGSSIRREDSQKTG